MTSAYFGQCLCGYIKYQVGEIEPQMGHCHCTMCQKFHGAAFSTYGESKKENFKWLSGTDYLKAYFAPNGTTRQFCGNCGSSLTFTSSEANSNVIEFSLGTLDSDVSIRPDAHIFTNHRVSWHSISDTLKQYPKARDA